MRGSRIGWGEEAVIFFSLSNEMGFKFTFVFSPAESKPGGLFLPEIFILKAVL